ncbi:MAG: hypothetical protein JRF55_09320 [Deltaproteobacteria bacterium]|nr:hypothetical protein [Deltaproteobacteria bacterium]
MGGQPLPSGRGSELLFDLHQKGICAVAIVDHQQGVARLGLLQRPRQHHEDQRHPRVADRHEENVLQLAAVHAQGAGNAPETPRVSGGDDCPRLYRALYVSVPCFGFGLERADVGVFAAPPGAQLLAGDGREPTQRCRPLFGDQDCAGPITQKLLRHRLQFAKTAVRRDHQDAAG